MRPERLRAHHLTGPGLPGPVDVVRAYGAMQAQDFAGVLWAIAQRIAPAYAPTERALRATFDDGALIRTHLLRPTWHLVTADDVRWLLALTGPRVQAAAATPYRRLGLDPATRRGGERVLHRTLEGGRAATRDEVRQALTRAGLAPDGQRLVFFLMHAELEGLICSGPLRGRDHTYMWLDDRAPPAPALPRDEALARLMTRYVTTHGPVSEQDATWWSGLTLRDVRAGLALAGPVLTSRVDADGVRRWSHAETPRPPRSRKAVVHLLPNFDEFVVAYRDRTALLPPRLAGDARASLAMLSQPVLVDGRQAGTWRRVSKSRHFVIEVDAFDDAAIDDARVRAAVARYAAYLDGPPASCNVRHQRSSTAMVSSR